MGMLIPVLAGSDSNVAPESHIDAMLFSTAWCLKTGRSLEETARIFKELSVIYRIIDSGGFQLLMAEQTKPKLISKNGKPEIEFNKPLLSFDKNKPVYQKNIINLTPEHVIKTTIAVNADITTALDYPLPKTSIPGVQEFEFMRSVYYNTFCARETSALWEKFCPQVKLLFPVQAYNLRQFNVFMDMLGTAVFYGPSLPTRNMPIAQLVLFLIKFWQMLFKIAHILGSSKFAVIAIAAYFARNYFDWVSFDATSWRRNAEYENYLLPFCLIPISIKPDTKINNEIPITCTCSWCSYYSSINEIQFLRYEEKSSFLRRHNWYVINEASKAFFGNAATPVTLRSFLMEKAGSTRRRVMEINEIFRCLSIVEIHKNQNISVLEKLLLGI